MQKTRKETQSSINSSVKIPAAQATVLDFDAINNNEIREFFCLFMILTKTMPQLRLRPGIFFAERLPSQLSETVVFELLANSSRCLLNENL